MAAVAESTAADQARPGDGDGSLAPAPPPIRSQPILVVVALSVVAGVIHAVAMVDHFAHYWLYGVLFLVVTYAQVLWGIWIYRHPQDRRVLVAGIVGNLAICAVWLLSRTVGMPFGPYTWNPESIGALDVMATVDQLALAGLVVVIVAPASRLGARLGWLGGVHSVRIAIMLCSASMFSILLGSHHHH